MYDLFSNHSTAILKKINDILSNNIGLKFKFSTFHRQYKPFRHMPPHTLILVNIRTSMLYVRMKFKMKWKTSMPPTVDIYIEGTKWKSTSYANVISIPLTLSSYDIYLVCVLKSANKNYFLTLIYFLLTFHISLEHMHFLTFIETQ